MKKVKINPKQIIDWNSFHSTFANLFNFPDYYGRNMNAWVDCMDEFTTELTLLDLGDCRDLKESNPDIIEALLECTSFINFRRIESNEEPVLLISLFT